MNSSSNFQISYGNDVYEFIENRIVMLVSPGFRSITADSAVGSGFRSAVINAIFPPNDLASSE